MMHSLRSRKSSSVLQCHLLYNALLVHPFLLLKGKKVRKIAPTELVAAMLCICSRDVLRLCEKVFKYVKPLERMQVVVALGGDYDKTIAAATYLLPNLHHL